MLLDPPKKLPPGWAKKTEKVGPVPKRGGGTVHWMKDNFVRFFFFKIKFGDVCYDKLKGFKWDFSKKNHHGCRILQKSDFQGQTSDKIPKNKEFQKL